MKITSIFNYFLTTLLHDNAETSTRHARRHKQRSKGPRCIGKPCSKYSRERESDNKKEKAAPSDKKHCAVKDVTATNTTVTQDVTQTEREPLIIQNLVIEEGTKDEGIERLYNNVMTASKDKG